MVSFWDNKNVPKLIAVMDAVLSQFAKNQVVNCMVSELHLNKAVTKLV